MKLIIPRLVRQKQENQFSKVIVTISILIPLVYTIVALYFVWYEKHIPDAITIGVYGFFGTELLAVAWRTKPQGECC